MRSLRTIRWRRVAAALAARAGRVRLEQQLEQQRERERLECAAGVQTPRPSR